MKGDALVQLITEHGFQSAGWVDYESARVQYQEHFQRYLSWIEEGRHGRMSYLDRGLDRRRDPKLVFPKVKSVVAAFSSYSSAPLGGVKGPKYARYLRQTDYHDRLKEQLESAIRAFQKNSGENFEFKVCVDTSAVLERTWAQLCGIGWIGKNTLLMNRDLGSYGLLATAFLDVELGQFQKTVTDLCGNCTRCIDACPTDALTENKLDSRKCISYLTLEHRGEWSVDSRIQSGLRDWVAGCDICQEVCPFNFKRTKSDPKPELDERYELSYAQLEIESREEYRSRVQDSALNRIKYDDFRRNLAQVEKNIAP